MIAFAGIDYSMTSPGIAVLKDDDIHLYALTHTPKHLGVAKHNNITVNIEHYPEYSSDIERFVLLSDFVCSVLSKYDNVVIGIEGYSMGSRNGMAFTIGENTGVLKYQLKTKFDIDPLVIPPTTVKKYATGKGNAKKDKMREAFVDSTGLVWADHFNVKNEDASPFSDMVDAYWIARYTMEHNNV